MRSNIPFATSESPMVATAAPVDTIASASLSCNDVFGNTGAAWAGLAAEIVHSASLVHDDIMDGDRMRRNVETVWLRFGLPQRA